MQKSRVLVCCICLVMRHTFCTKNPTSTLYLRDKLFLHESLRPQFSHIYIHNKLQEPLEIALKIGGAVFLKDPWFQHNIPPTLAAHGSIIPVISLLRHQAIEPFYSEGTSTIDLLIGKPGSSIACKHALTYYKQGNSLTSLLSQSVNDGKKTVPQKKHTSILVVPWKDNKKIKLVCQRYRRHTNLFCDIIYVISEIRQS